MKKKGTFPFLLLKSQTFGWGRGKGLKREEDKPEPHFLIQDDLSEN